MRAELCCPVCKQTEDFTPVDRHQRWTIYACADCGLQFADPLDTKEIIYEESSRASRVLSSLKHRTPREFRTWAMQRAGMWRRTSPALRWLKSHVAPGSVVLDIGCGAGIFLTQLERAGFKPVGLDVSDTLAEVLRDKGFRIHVGSVDEYPRDWPQPQAIVALEVIEHVPDPIGFLRGIRERFPGVPLLMTTPSPRSWALQFGIRLPVDYPPHHLMWWSERSLKLAVLSAGYESADLAFHSVLSEELYYTASTWFIFHRLLGVVPTSQQLSSDERSSVRAMYKGLSRVYPVVSWLQERFIPTVLTPVTIPVARMLTARGLSRLSVDVVAL
jgi:SAM-dependent methyltransferase